MLVLDPADIEGSSPYLTGINVTDREPRSDYNFVRV